jgi:hypothetical protein
VSQGEADRPELTSSARLAWRRNFPAGRLFARQQANKPFGAVQKLLLTPGNREAPNTRLSSGEGFSSVAAIKPQQLLRVGAATMISQPEKPKPIIFSPFDAEEDTTDMLLDLLLHEKPYWEKDTDEQQNDTSKPEFARQGPPSLREIADML